MQNIKVVKELINVGEGAKMVHGEKGTCLSCEYGNKRCYLRKTEWKDVECLFPYNVTEAVKILDKKLKPYNGPLRRGRWHYPGHTCGHFKRSEIYKVHG